MVTGYFIVVSNPQFWPGVGFQENKNKKGLLSIGKEGRLEVKEGKIHICNLTIRSKRLVIHPAPCFNINFGNYMCTLQMFHGRLKTTIGTFVFMFKKNNPFKQMFHISSKDSPPPPCFKYKFDHYVHHRDI